MNKQEKENLRQEYKSLRGIYRLLKEDLKTALPDSLEMYEIRRNISMVGWQISSIRTRLILAPFEKICPTAIFDNFFFGDENEQIKGGR